MRPVGTSPLPLNELPLELGAEIVSHAARYSNVNEFEPWTRDTTAFRELARVSKKFRAYVLYAQRYVFSRRESYDITKSLFYNIRNAGRREHTRLFQWAVKNFPHVSIPTNQLGSLARRAMIDNYATGNRGVLINIEYHVARHAGNEVLDSIKSDFSRIKSNNIESLNMFQRLVHDVQAQSVARILRHRNCRVTSVDFGASCFGRDGMKAIVRSLAIPHSTVKNFDMRGSSICADSAKLLARALKHTKITRLNLYRTDIPRLGTKELFAAFKNPTCKVEVLNYGSNEIGNRGAKDLSKILADGCSNLRIIKIHKNSIGNRGAKALAEALKNPNCKVESLDLRWNKIGAEGQQALMDAAKVRPDITLILA